MGQTADHRERSRMVAAGGATPAGATFLGRLRSETQALHASAEGSIAAAVRLHDVDGYARLLRSLHPLYASIEAQLAAFPDWSTLEPPLDLVRRRRAHLIDADLRALGAFGSCSGVRRGALPVLEEFPRAFGALYVVEGSRLGGCVLARQASRAVGGVVEGACRFLRSDGSEVGPLWRELRTALGRYATHSGSLARDAVVSGAIDTFYCFDRQLARWEP
jgi:heme oxygenase (biliverdin-IX-beta and delta-forming)